MKNIKFVKQPGFVYDLFFLFALHFNKDYFLKHGINYNKSTEDTNYYNSILKDFSPIPDELVLFFHLGEDKQCVMTKYYFKPYHNMFFTDKYNTSVVYEALSNYEQITENVIRFYFKDADDKTVAECKSSLYAANKLICNSDYSPEIKSALYSFLIDPARIVHKLSYELIQKEFELNKRYNDNASHIAQLQLSFDCDLLCEGLKKCKIESISIDDFNNLYISYCFLHKNLIKSLFNDDEIIILLGSDYIDTIGYLEVKNYIPDLELFGNAIAEPNRVSVLNLILERGEITIKDLEQEFGFTGTNAYYHISLMIKAGMVKSRNRGRTVLYSINNQYFQTLINTLMKYNKG